MATAGSSPTPSPAKASSSSFLDDWLAKRKQLGASKPPTLATTAPQPASGSGSQPNPSMPSSAPVATTSDNSVAPGGSVQNSDAPVEQSIVPKKDIPSEGEPTSSDKLDLRKQADSEVHVKLH